MKQVKTRWYLRHLNVHTHNYLSSLAGTKLKSDAPGNDGKEKKKTIMEIKVEEEIKSNNFGIISDMCNTLFIENWSNYYIPFRWG